MTIIDNDARLFGRINLIDAGVALLVLVLIPVAYGAYALFRTPPAKLREIAPTKLAEGPNLRIQVWGQNLRPFMRVSFGSVQGRTFLIASPKGAEVELPDLPPGTYDVVLYDYAQEVDRLPNALEILPSAQVPTVQLEVGGAFQGVPPAIVKRIVAGLKVPDDAPPQAEVISVEAPREAELRVRAGDATFGLPIEGQQQVPATLRVWCVADSYADGSIRCLVPGPRPRQPVIVGPDGVLTFRAFGGWLTYQITEVHSSAGREMVDARIRFVVTPEVLARIKVGDRDTGLRLYAREFAARIVALNGTHAAPALLARGSLAGDAARVLDATVKIPIERTPDGWTYRARPIKIGSAFSFETAQYILSGEVAEIAFPNASRH